jgi:hypothetical protein
MVRLLVSNQTNGTANTTADMSTGSLSAPTVIYPSNLIFKNNDIANGGSALFVIGKPFFF